MSNAESSPEIDKNATDDRAYKELVGLFHSPTDLENAIDEINSSGWDRAVLSLLAQHSVLMPEQVDGNTTELADDPESERHPTLLDSDVRQGRTVLAGMAGIAAALIASGATIMTGGGTMAAVVGAAVAGGGAGGLVEALGQKIGSTREKFFEEQLKHGGILLWVKLDTPEGEKKAREIFKKHGASEIHIHASEPAA